MHFGAANERKKAELKAMMRLGKGKLHSLHTYSKEEGSRVLPQKSYLIAIPRNDTVLLALSLLETTNEIHNNSTASLSFLVRGGFK